MGGNGWWGYTIRRREWERAPQPSPAGGVEEGREDRYTQFPPLPRVQHMRIYISPFGTSTPYIGSIGQQQLTGA